MDIKQLTDDLKARRIDEFRLLDLVVAQAAIIQKLEKRIAELERGPEDKFDEPFSVREEEQRQADKSRKKKSMCWRCPSTKSVRYRISSTIQLF